MLPSKPICKKIEITGYIILCLNRIIISSRRFSRLTIRRILVLREGTIGQATWNLEGQIPVIYQRYRMEIQSQGSGVFDLLVQILLGADN